MIGTCARKSIGGAMRSLILMVLMAGPALAGPGAPEQAEPLGSDSVGQRVRDRERMQMEYEAMREERARQLAAARERATALVAGGIDETGRASVDNVNPLPSNDPGGASPAEAAGGITPEEAAEEEGGISFRTAAVYGAFILVWLFVWLGLVRKRGDFA